MMNPTLTSEQAFILYRGLVCDAIVKADAIALVGDVWEFSECLDMSFDETAQQDFYKWPRLIQSDLEEFLRKPNGRDYFVQ